ncbi:MAG: hypothetical protein CMO01_28480 [Thalassobius sp.]|nr:hypothetical protein [Thalassovita sp.]
MGNPRIKTLISLQKREDIESGEPGYELFYKLDLDSEKYGIQMIKKKAIQYDKTQEEEIVLEYEIYVSTNMVNSLEGSIKIKHSELHLGKIEATKIRLTAILEGIPSMLGSIAIENVAENSDDDDTPGANRRIKAMMYLQKQKEGSMILEAVLKSYDTQIKSIEETKMTQLDGIYAISVKLNEVASDVPTIYPLPTIEIPKGFEGLVRLNTVEGEHGDHEEDEHDHEDEHKIEAASHDGTSSIHTKDGDDEE